MAHFRRHPLVFLSFAALAAACAHDALPSGQPDLAMPDQLSPCAACKPGQQCVLDVCIGGDHEQLWIEEIQLPRFNNQPPSLDFDGTGRMNHLPVLLNALTQVLGMGGSTFQENVHVLIQEGRIVLLLDMPSAAAAPAQSLTIFEGEPTNSPAVNGTFTIRRDRAPTVFPPGPRTADGYEYVVRPGERIPLVTLRIPASAGALASDMDLQFPLHVHHLRLQSNQGATQGEMQGTIRWTDVTTILGPSIQKYLSWQLKNNPSYKGFESVYVQLYDRGDGTGSNCINGDGSPGRIGDGYVSDCELLIGMGITRERMADVHVYDGDRFAPSATAERDAISFGMYLMAAPATLR